MSGKRWMASKTFREMRRGGQQLSRQEAIAILEALGCKYNPEDSGKNLQAEIARGIDRLVMVAISIDHLTGKEAIELTRQRRTEDRS